MRVRFSARSDVGIRREINQDAYGAKELPQATLLIVCDGMGGHAAGEVASSLGVATIINTFADAIPPETALRDAFIAANTEIYTTGHGSMGTTGVAAFFHGNSLHIANVGDSRAYLVREGQIAQISQDHSFVSDQVAAGLMTAEQARTSNVRNIITRALGYQPEVQVDIFALTLRPGDTVLLSSDGMHGLIEDNEIAEIASMLPPDEAAQRLVNKANERGGPDNITVVIAQIDEIDPPPVDDEPSHSAITQPIEVSTVPIPSPNQDQPPAALPIASEPVERSLSRLGLLLAALTLIVLISAAGLLLANPAPVSAPTSSPSPSLRPTVPTLVTVTPTRTPIQPSPTATRSR